MGVSTGQDHMIMKGRRLSYRVEGGELFDRVVSAGKFSERIAKLLFYQMLVAVKVCVCVREREERDKTPFHLPPVPP